MKTMSTNDRMSSVIFWLTFWFTTYPFSILLGLIFFALRVFGWVKIIHPERIPFPKGRLIIAPNHPTLYEAPLLAVLEFPYYVTDPYRLIPFCTPDPNLPIKNPAFFFMHTRFIWVPRSDTNTLVVAFRQMLTILKNDMRIILFPEGGRTTKADRNEIIAFKTGVYIRKPKQGIGRLVKASQAPVLPVWINIVRKKDAWILKSWRRMTFVIGEPIRFEDIKRVDPQLIEERVIQSWKKLADEVP